MSTREVPTSIATRTADISLVRPGLIEQRYRQDAQFTMEVVHENIAAIDELCAHHGPCAMLTVFSPGMAINPALMNDDHYRDLRRKGTIRALAVVTDSQALHMASKLYFMYHPQAFATRIFEEEGDAMRWLREQMEAKGAA